MKNIELYHIEKPHKGKLWKQAQIQTQPNYKFPNGFLEKLDNNLRRIHADHPNVINFDRLVKWENWEWQGASAYYDHYFILFAKTAHTTFNIPKLTHKSSDASLFVKEFAIKNKKNGHILAFWNSRNATGTLKVEYVDDKDIFTFVGKDNPYEEVPISFTSIFPTSTDVELNNILKDFKGYYPNHGQIRELLNHLKSKPMEPPPDSQPEEDEGETANCSNTGQFGGGGNPLKDIKLFLYANKVTKGTITLNKPQVEVGTYATDWRPNPADATKSIEMMLKQIESVKKGGRKNGKKRD